jgi:hypothetical protein
MTPSARTNRTPWAGVALIAAALVAGCSSSSSPSSSSAGSSASTSPSSSAAASGASDPSASPTSAAAGSSSTGGATAAACTTQDLKAKVGAAQGAAGSVYQPIDFTNISGAPCTLYGYPGISLAGSSESAQIGAAATRSKTASASVVTLAAGAAGNALLQVADAGNYPTSACGPVSSSYLKIYPPNQTTPIYLSYKSTGCSKRSVNLLTIGVVQPGSGSNS